MPKVEKDQAGFHYYEHELDEYRVVLFRSKDIESILQIAPENTALEENYVDLHDAVMLAMSSGKEEFAMYLNQQYVGDHMHPSTPGAPLPRIVGNDVLEADREWAGLVEQSC